MSNIYFDDTLPVFAALAKENWGAQALKTNLFLRDVDGRLTLVVLDNHTLEERKELTQKINEKLGVYVDTDFAVATPDELFDDTLKDFTQAHLLRVSNKGYFEEVWLIDRRLVGADWLLNPAPAVRSPKRIVFTSMKGGVGRSTALCIVAAHMAALGKRVLTIDLDLEAPGLGNMLLPGETLPEFGLLDYLVEQHIGPLSDEFFIDMKASSWLGGGVGRVDVVPALGNRSLKNPANVLAKIARAYLVNSNRDSKTLSGFTSHMQGLLNRIALSVAYDVVLIDARAGLHETTAAAVIGLGAEVLLFGINQTQTIADYEILFAHLATLNWSPDNDWRERLNIVHAKASLDRNDHIEFTEKMQNLMKKYLWPAEHQTRVVDLDALRGEFETEWTDQIQATIEEVPFEPMIIPDSEHFRSFDPLRDRNGLEERIYSDTFGEFLNRIDEILNND